MNSNSPQEMAESGYGIFVVICTVYLVIFVLAGSMVMAKRDV